MCVCVCVCVYVCVCVCYFLDTKDFSLLTIPTSLLTSMSL